MPRDEIERLLRSVSVMADKASDDYVNSALLDLAAAVRHLAARLPQGEGDVAPDWVSAWREWRIEHDGRDQIDSFAAGYHRGWAARGGERP